MITTGEKLKVGDLVTVQVVRDKIKTKRYAVTTDISLQGDYAVTTLFAPVGVSSKITDSARKKELKTLMQNLLIAEQDAQFYLAEGNVAEIERIKKSLHLVELSGRRQSMRRMLRLRGKSKDRHDCFIRL